MSLLDAMLQDPHKHPQDVWIALRTNEGINNTSDIHPLDGGVKSQRAQGVTLTHTVKTALATSVSDHGYSNGDLVSITDALVGGVSSTLYNGSFFIHSVTAITFKYNMAEDPMANADTSPVPQAQRIVPKGPGTADDPLDGGVVLEAAREVALTRTGSTALATTGSTHPYNDADLVTISDAKISGILSQHYNGTFVIHSVTETTFKYEMTGPPSADADDTPSPEARRKVLLFDEIMKGFSTVNLLNVAIHIGPGIFETRGNGGESSAGTIGWRMRQGWKIIGSGIDVTTLKLVGAQNIGIGAYHVIGPKEFGFLAHDSEATNLTVDCNLRGTENGSGVAVAAVKLVGNRVRIRRVRAIQFGTWQPRPQGGLAPESFVLVVGGRGGGLPEPTHCVIEECIVEQRAAVSGLDNCTCLGIGSGETTGDGVMEHPRGCVIRNNLVDGRLPDGGLNLNQQVWGCSASGVGAIVENNRFYNLWTGGPYHDTWTHLDTVVRNNHYRNVRIGIWERVARVSTTNQFIKFNSLTSETVGGKHIAHAETFKAHGLTTNDRVDIVDLNKPEPSAPDSHYYGDYQVIPHLTDPTRFDYEMAALPSTPSLPNGSQTPAYAQVRNNNFESNQRLLASLTYSTSPLVATAQIADSEATYGIEFEKHDFKKGDVVQILGASEPEFNGRFIVVEVVDAKTFKYALDSEPSANSISGYYGRMWQTKKLTIENNLFELARGASGTAGVQVNTLSVLLGPPYVYPQLVIRNNLFYHYGEEPATGELAFAIRLENVKHAVIEGNRIQLDRDNPISVSSIANVQNFNNRDKDERLIHTYNEDTGLYETESVASRIQDATVMALL